MLRRPHCCALIVGVSLVLLALVLAARVELATHHDRSSQAVRVVQAMTHLEGGCLTCHSAVTDSAYAEVAYYHSMDAVPAETPLQIQVDAQLRDLGQRILALSESPGSEAVVEAFVQAVDDTRLARVDADPQVILGRIAAVEAILRHLENQASPFKWSRPDGPTIRLAVAALSSAPPVPPAAALHQVVWLQAGVSCSWALSDAPRLVMPFEVAYAVLRRGPPAGSFSDSVWSGRLLST